MSTGLINPDRPSPCHSATENQCFRFVVKSISRSPFAFGGGGIFHRDPTQLSAAIQLVLRRGHFKCDGILTKTRFRLSAKRTNPFKSSGVSVQSTTGSRGVCINGSNAGYAMFRGSVKRTGYPLHSPFSSSLPLPCVTMYNHISTGVYLLSIAACVLNGQLLRCYSQYKYIGCAATVSINTSAVLGLSRFDKGRHWVSAEDWLILTDLDGVISQKTGTYFRISVTTTKPRVNLMFCRTAATVTVYCVVSVRSWTLKQVQKFLKTSVPVTTSETNSRKSGSWMQI